MFNATAGSATATSLCDVAFADGYWTGRLYNDAWTAAQPTAKQGALQLATLLIDGKLWLGRAATQAQALSWPRLGVVTRDQYVVPYDSIPMKIQQACAELAGALLSEDRTADGGPINIDKLKVGPIDITFSEFSRTNTIPPLVDALCAPYLGSAFSQTRRT